MVWNNTHKSRGFDRIYTEDLFDINKRMQNSFSILDCILDENKAKLIHSSNTTFHICLYDNFLLNCWTLSCVRRSINFDLFVNNRLTISSLKAKNN